MTRRPSRYSAVAISLHWLIAVAILSMIPMGWWMSDAIVEPDTQALAYRVFQIHKSIGFLILALTVLRIVWRLTHPVPSLPGAMKGWEQFAARATHAAFYALMLALPLTGWVYVSTGWAVVTDTPLAVATSWFGLFTIPHLPFIEHASETARRATAWMAMGAHSKLAWGAIVLVALHVGAALKHQFFERDGVLSQMIPVLPHGDDAHGVAPEPTPAIRWAERMAGVAFVVVIGVAFGLAAKPAPKAEGQAVASAPAAAPATDAPVTPGTAAAWTVDKAASTIQFTGTHTGKAFTGRFEQWDAQVWFDPADLAGSKAVVTVQTGTARTGDATQEGSLPGAEWFDTSTYPTARFEATAFKALGGNRYEATGTLRIKTTTVPVVLPFTFDEANGTATVAGKLELDRTALNMGMMSDAAGDWVSKAIGVEIKVKAARAG
ncbi:YceI family protein [Brevundimonas naejangsanensis]|uniref:YceI family protein n=1 Tax=Brevundimonas naejangsanensis TaxID=588932 RepID=UPI0026F17F4A|nr:YceI family protein [Brevundimonas naejangsanensis]